MADYKRIEEIRQRQRYADANKPKVSTGEVMAFDASEMLFGSRAKSIVRYNPSVLVTRKGLAVIDKMRKDDQIKAATVFKKSTVLATGWEIVSPEGMPDDWEPTEFVKNNLLTMDGTFERRLMDILTALDYGYSITEKVWKARDNKIVLNAIKTKRPHDVEFATDQFGNLTAIQQMTHDMPIDKFILYTYDMEFQNWYGNSDLEAAYRAWWSKDNSYKWLAMLLERLGIPPIFALYDSSFYSNENLTQLQKVLENMQAATVGSIPKSESKDGGKSIEFWTPELAKNVADVFIPALDMYNKDIARAILMPGLLGMTPDDNVGSNARSEVHFDVFMLVIDRIRNEISEYVMQEQIIKPLIDLNFTVKEYPKFKFLPLDDELRLEVFDKWRTLADSNIVKSTSQDEIHIRKSLKFPEREIDENEEYGKTQKQEFSIQTSDFEKRVDFVKIEKQLTSIEQSTIAVLRDEIKDSQNKLLKMVENETNKTMAWANAFNLSKTSKISRIVKEHLRTAMENGRVDIQSNIKRYEYPGLLPTEALLYLTQKSLNIAGIINDSLQSSARNVLLDSIKNGWTFGETSQKLKEVFLPYIGDETTIKDGDVINPFRLETIIRTNTTTAFNQGRLIEMRKEKSYIRGVAYSSIIDGRQTHVCEFLNRKIFRLDDSDLDKLTPPNHFNCRAILVPIMIDEVLNESDFITTAQKGRAFELSGKGFA